MTFRSVTAEEFERVVGSEECDVELNDTDPPTLIYTHVPTGEHIATRVLHYDPATPASFFLAS